GRAKLAVHPGGGDSTQELYLTCDDLDATMAELSAKGVTFQPVTERRWESSLRRSCPVARNSVCSSRGTPPRTSCTGLSASRMLSLVVGGEGCYHSLANQRVEVEPGRGVLAQMRLQQLLFVVGQDFLDRPFGGVDAGCADLLEEAGGHGVGQ